MSGRTSSGDDEQVLHGGVGNAGAVVRVGAHVLRPTSPHSPAIHALLRHCHDVGFDGVPELIGTDPDGRERLVFVPGDVPVPPFPRWSQSDAVLASTAALLRRFHDAMVGFAAPAGSSWSDEMVDPTPGDDPVICHNDVCPENVVYRDGVAVVLLDLEFAAPGRRTHDVASLARMCAPIETDEDAARTGRGGLDPVTRLAVVADAYGLEGADRIELLDVLDEQFERGGEFVRRRMARGEQAFVDMWHATGGAERYLRRRRWFAAERGRFEEALSGGAAPSGPSPPTTP
ncbi:MAG: phosphotransferase [Actinomycetota bacterium]|nr:phosphotransferase [Actinomycetota bacterium]